MPGQPLAELGVNSKLPGKLGREELSKALDLIIQAISSPKNGRLFIMGTHLVTAAASPAVHLIREPN